MISPLSNNIGKEVYVLGGSLEGTGASTHTTISRNLKTIRQELINISAEDYDDILVVHGMLSSAVSIPGELQSGIKPFILLNNANTAGDDYVVEVDDLEHLISIVETITKKRTNKYFGRSEGLLDSLFEVDQLDIENIFIVYGYKLKMTLGIPIDSIDYNKQRLCQKIFDDIKTAQI